MVDGANSVGSEWSEMLGVDCCRDAVFEGGVNVVAQGVLVEEYLVLSFNGCNGCGCGAYRDDGYGTRVGRSDERVVRGFFSVLCRSEDESKVSVVAITEGGRDAGRINLEAFLELVECGEGWDTFDWNDVFREPVEDRVVRVGRTGAHGEW